ncbi:kinase-like domain-containing protein [Diaporthe sp. PMI_573]|nr:kinase-like domain-containing protein [Diaporthaceae sp. PMI_573]
MSRPQSILATLTPENAQAQKCLESLVEKHGLSSLSTSLRINPNVPKHSRRSSQSRYQLVLSLDREGAGLGGPWRVGKLGPKSVGIDLPICSIRSRQFQGTKVCKIYIHPQSHVLMLQNSNEYNSITYLLGDGNADAELQYGETHVIHMKTNHLRFGPLDFVLEFSVEDVGAFAASRRTYMQRHLRQDAGPDSECEEDQQQQVQGHSCLDPLPTREQLRVRDVILHHTVGKGAFGLVMVGVDRWSGDMVACKMIHCRSHDAQGVNSELLIASRIPLGTVGLVPLSSSWCEHGQSPACFQSIYETVYMIMPYAPLSFSTTAWRKVAPATRLALFRQVLEGLRNLHAMGIMHRDISPQNLLVFSLVPPQAAICDYGKSKVGTRGHQGALGPQGFTAPEVGGPAGYTSAIDIFSLGLSLLATFGRWAGWNKSLSSPDIYQLVLQHLAGLEDVMPDGLGALLRSMLAWDPADRPTAEDALAHQVWEQVVVAGSGLPPSTSSSSSSSGNATGSSTAAARRRRSGGMSPSGSRGMNKRMRVSDLPPPPPLSGSKIRRSDARGSGVGRMKESGITRTSGSDSLLSPPPA